MPDPSDELAQAAADLGRAIEPPGYQDLVVWIVQHGPGGHRAEAASIAVLDPREETLRSSRRRARRATRSWASRCTPARGIAGWAARIGPIDHDLGRAPQRSPVRGTRRGRLRPGYTPPRCSRSLWKSVPARGRDWRSSRRREEGRDHEPRTESRVVTNAGLPGRGRDRDHEPVPRPGRVLFRARRPWRPPTMTST
jgi:hypothetical protein